MFHSFVIRFGLHFDSILTLFCIHFGSILTSFWIHFGVFGGSWEGAAKRPRTVSIWGSLWAAHRLHFSSKIRTCVQWKSASFVYRSLIAFWLHFGRLVVSIFHQKNSMKWRKWFYRSERFADTKAPFPRVGPSTSIQKVTKNQAKKTMQFFIKKLTPKSLQ